MRLAGGDALELEKIANASHLGRRRRRHPGNVGSKQRIEGATDIPNRFIRAVTTPTLTGGTSPTILLATDIVLGGEALLPAV